MVEALPAPVPEAHLAAATRAREALDNAELWLAGGDPYLARLALADIDLAALSGDTAVHAATLMIDADLALGLFEDASRRLGTLRLPPAETARLRATLCDNAGQLQCAFEQRVEAAIHAPASTDTNDAVWAALIRWQTSADAGFVPLVGNNTVTGWLELAAVVRGGASLDAQRQAYADWARAHPDHPASLQLPQAIRYLAADQPSATTAITVWLPLSGPLRGIGQAVRDGMLSALLEDEPMQRPNLSFQDVAVTTPGQMLEAPGTQNAEFIVGPLVRDSVQALATINPLRPVLALNYLNGPAPRNDFYQFGLAIEDEAVTMAAWLRSQRARSVLFVLTNANWAARALAELERHWQGKSKVITVASARETTEAVGGALEITDAFRRNIAIQTLLGGNVRVGETRHDEWDAVVALTDTEQTSSLGPALRFHGLNDTPILLGTQSARYNTDLSELNGARVVEIPALLDGGATMNRLSQTWNKRGRADFGFYALGADAYALVRRLPTTGYATRLDLWGATGFLAMRPDGSIHRQLGIGRIKRGRVSSAAAADVRTR